MKHIKNFESFEKVEEGFDVGNIGAGVSKFFTGHKGSEEKESAKQKILSDIKDKVAKLVSNGWIKEADAESRIQSLIKQAKENNWKGKITLRKSPRTNQLFVVYDSGTSGLQNLGTSAYSSVKGNL